MKGINVKGGKRRILYDDTTRVHIPLGTRIHECGLAHMSLFKVG